MENCVGKIDEYDDQINRIKPLNQRQGIWKLIHNQVIYRQPIQERQSIKSFSAAFGTMPAYSTLVGAVWLCGNWSGWTTSAFLMTDTRGFAVHYIHQAQTKGIYLREWWIVQGLYTFGRFYRNYQFKLSSSSSSSFPDFFLFFFFLYPFRVNLTCLFLSKNRIPPLHSLLLLLLGVDSKNLSRYGPDLSG